MAYIGREPAFGSFERQALTADGSTTTFTLNYTVGSSSSILVSVAGVVQDPEGAYSVSGGGTSIVFSSAPASGDTVFLIFLGIAFDSANLLSTGSITSQTDLGEAPATGDSMLLFDTSASALKEMTVANLFTSPTITTPVITEIDSGSTITLDATTDIVLDADGANITMKDGGTTVLDFVLNGSTNVTLDAPGDIILDADGGDLKFADGGTDLLGFSNSSSDVVVKPLVDAKDIIIQQFDGTSLVEFNDGAFSKFTAMAYFPEATLTDASTIAWNVLTSPVAKVTLGANRTLGAATGAQAGQFVSLLIIQDGTGSRTVTFNAAYEFKDDTAPTLTTTAAKGDLFVFRYNGSKFLEVGRNLNLTLS